MPRSLPLALILLLALPAAAQAGTYRVYTCAAGGKTYANGAWKATAAAGVVADTSCAGGTIGLTVAAGARMTDNTSAALTFTSPTGTTITNFTLSRQIGYTNPVAADTHRYFLLSSFGATPFAGAGNYNDTIRDALNAQKHWYGHPEKNVALARAGVTKATFPALATASANQIVLRVGCFKRGTPCSVNTGGAISHLLWGTDVTINDPTAPSVAVEASGLLAGGTRGGSDPVTVTASDAAGIRRVELFDVSSGTPQPVGAEDYAAGRTDGGKTCDYSLPAPCPQLSRETIRPSALAAGNRSLLVRVTDTGGNVVERGPYPVFAVTPSDRGAANGSDVTETGTIHAIWTKTRKASRRTVAYGTKAGVRVRLTNSDGRPIAGAKVVLLTRDLRAGADIVTRNTLTTDADGRFSTVVTASASRQLHFAWLSHANDIRFAANAYLTLKARASARLRVSTRRPRVGRNLTVSGRLRGIPSAGVPVIVQGRKKGTRRFKTFDDTTTSASGRFKVRYQFQDSGSRGHTFEFRARILPSARYPYEVGYSRTIRVKVR